ncbi:sodium-extruding oxaloacetate decarboxylase subunit alpha [Methanosalsum natronophilum]|nr:sodium-extruding oxaloacetate decarboxylase subunit alpha [Methanosalsum natronophilum]MCS3922970.1 pyruvate carboxylase subunit B [Methanosalsum natronophilum]
MKVKITETVLRDAHQSLLATRMRTEDMLPVIDKLDEAGYFSLEMWGGATFDTCIRYLNEDPWVRLREIKQHMRKTKAQMLLRGQNLVGYRHYSDDVVEKFVSKAFENGIDIFRIFDAVNDVRNMQTSIKTATDIGAHVQGAISYTISPVHTTEKYVEFAKELEHMGCDSLCIKDMAGLISPHNAKSLIQSLKDEISLPIALHSHCTSGMAPMSYMAACEAGVDILDTALSPLSWGTSQPPSESIVAGLQGTPYETGLDLKCMTEAALYFRNLKSKYQCILDPISEQIDTNVLLYQIPGGMLSNLVSQLKEQNALDKYEEVLEEMPRVRAELGYPPLVTPTSQIVGTQAVLNVLMGERYKVVPKEVKDYVRGLYGRPPKPMDQDFVAMIIGEETPITSRPADLLSPEYDKMKLQAEEMGIIKKEEDILTYILYPSVAPKFLKGELEPEVLTPVMANDCKDIISQNTSYPTEFKVEVEGDVFNVKVEPKSGTLNISENSEKDKPQNPIESKGSVKCDMQGVVLSVDVDTGDQVEAGDTLCVIEAMKMENSVSASQSGTVKEIYVSNGDSVSTGDILMLIE